MNASPKLNYPVPVTILIGLLGAGKTLCKKNLQPLAMSTDFSSTSANNPWLIALDWMKTVLSRQQSLGQRPIDEIPGGTIPNRLRQHLLIWMKKAMSRGFVATDMNSGFIARPENASTLTSFI